MVARIKRKRRYPGRAGHRACSFQLRQLVAQHFDAGRNRIGIDGVKAHAEKVFRRRGVEEMARAGFNQHPGMSGTPSAAAY